MIYISNIKIHMKNIKFFLVYPPIASSFTLYFRNQCFLKFKSNQIHSKEIASFLQEIV